VLHNPKLTDAAVEGGVLLGVCKLVDLFKREFGGKPLEMRMTTTQYKQLEEEVRALPENFHLLWGNYEFMGIKINIDDRGVEK